MRDRAIGDALRKAGTWGAMGMWLAAGASCAWGAPRQHVCMQEVAEGSVRRGGSFEQILGGGLTLRMEAVPEGGWVLRVLPTGQPRPAEDYAELATPPYRSINPLRITTGFGFRAQDAAGWNPRRFRFVTGPAMFRKIEPAFQRLGGSGAAEAELGGLLQGAPEGVLELLDAGLVPGSADPTSAASLVGTHLGATAHTMDAPEGGRGSPLGQLNWIQFRVRLNRTGVAAVPAGVRREARVCSADELFRR